MTPRAPLPVPPPAHVRLAASLARIRERIEAARGRSPHAAARVDLVVVTKGAPGEFLPVLAQAGVTDVAENRVQVARAHQAVASPGLRWHLVGHLQRNKAQHAVGLFDCFHALDSLALAERLHPFLKSENRRWAVYIQVNAAADPRKGGVPAEEAVSFARSLASFPHLELLGFMTMARLDAGETQTRAAFRALREVRAEALRLGVGPRAPDGLSMGMSADFEWAVEEGASVVRVGSAVFEGASTMPPRAAPEVRDAEDTFAADTIAEDTPAGEWPGSTGPRNAAPRGVRGEQA